MVPGAPATARSLPPVSRMIDYAILGLLQQQPDHGYRIRQRLVERLGPTWDLNPGQVYLVLHGLKRHGLIVSVLEDPPDPLQRRRRFAITPRGERVLARWLRRVPRVLRPARTELEIALMLLYPGPAEELQAYLDATLAAVESTEAWLRGRAPGGAEDPIRRLSVTRTLQEVDAIRTWVHQARAEVAGGAVLPDRRVG